MLVVRHGPRIWGSTASWRARIPRRASSALANCFSVPQAAPRTAPLPPTGLFGNPHLASPSSFQEFADTSLKAAANMSAEIGNTVVDANTAALVVQKLDVLSDTLCKVVDGAAFIRISHPQARMASTAQRVHEQIFTFMNELNTDRQLYDRVCEALVHKDHLSNEEQRVALILKHDFEKSGIQYDSAAERQVFVDASNTVSVLGQEFLMGIGPASASLAFDSKELEGVAPQLLAQLPRQPFSGRLRVPLAELPQVGEHILATAHNSEVRHRIWKALRTAPRHQVELLHHVLTSRHRIAELAGYPNFAAYELSDKLMGGPGQVSNFLGALNSAVRPQALKEIANLGVVAPWDWSYVQRRRQQRQRSRQGLFELGSVLQGFSTLSDRLFGLSLMPASHAPGEVWDDEVRRLDVYQDGLRVGTVYCDLFSREGKQPNPAHFTIQCSRTIWGWEVPEAQSKSQTPDEPGKQLPIIALVCDFDRSGFLSLYEVQTLFHEMGHAIHSMVGRTALHNVAGTRCATDFVELPSILMEKFASQPSVLALFGNNMNMSASATAPESPWETHHQIWLASVDQALHAGPPPANLAEAAHAVEDRLSLFPELSPEQQHTMQFAQFGHLVSYGATYYSYLLDRCLANMTWQHLFANDPLSEEGGHRFRDAVLKWGGSRDPRSCVEDLLGHELDFKEVATFI